MRSITLGSFLLLAACSSSSSPGSSSGEAGATGTDCTFDVSVSTTCMGPGYACVGDSIPAGCNQSVLQCSPASTSGGVCIDTPSINCTGNGAACPGAFGIGCQFATDNPATIYPGVTCSSDTSGTGNFNYCCKAK